MEILNRVFESKKTFIDSECFNEPYHRLIVPLSVTNGKYYIVDLTNKSESSEVSRGYILKNFNRRK